MAYDIIIIILAIVLIVGWWKVFTKAGEQGWKSIIPIYNMITMLKIVGRPWWWVIALFIPFVNIVVFFVVFIELAKAFGHGVGFGVGLVLLSPIFILILGYGSDQYHGPLSTPQSQFAT